VIGGRSATVVRANSPASTALMLATARNNSTVVDIIDPARRQLLASVTFEEELYTSIGGGLFAVRRINTDGVITFDVYRLVVTNARTIGMDSR
jgi:hypothetical protein